MKLFLLLTLAAFASAKSALHILGDEECTRGPAFWCQDYKSAKQCGSVKYCTEHHWKKQLKGTVCDECKTVITKVHSYIADNITETEVIQALEAVCSMLGTYAAECKSLVSIYGKEMIELMKEYTADPSLICKMLGLCSSAKHFSFETMKAGPIVFGGEKHTQEPKSSALCIACEFVMTEVDRLLDNEATEEKIVEVVEKVCNYLPSTIKTECDALISEYGKQIIDLLVKKLKPKQVCTELKLCSATLAKKMLKTSVNSVKSAVECEACQLIVTYVDTLLKNNKTEAEIKEVLTTLCSYLGSYKTVCDTIVSEDLTLIIKYVTQMKPDFVCKKIDLCSSSNAKAKVVESKNSGALCTTCKVVVGYADALLKAKTTESEIVSLVEKLCATLGTFKSECDSLVSAYLPEILKLLAAELSPDLVCKELGLCTSKTGLKKVMPAQVESGVSCEACELVVGYVYKLVDSKTEAEITTEVEKFCSVLGAYKDECKSLVATYLPEIINLLKQELTPALVCKELGLCTAMKNLMRKVKTVKVESGVSCEACELVVGYVYKLVDSKTEAEITAEVEKFCNVLGTYKDECKSLVAAYLPEIINLLKQELTPALVCKELGLCTAMKNLMRKVKTVKVESGVSCEACELVVGYVYKLVDSKTEAEITAEVEKFCSVLGAYKDECKSLVAAYLPEIINLLKQELTPALVCKELGLCTAMKNLMRKVKTVKAPKDGEFCVFCKMVVGYADAELKKKKTEAEIAKDVEQICALMPSIKAQCDSYVEAYLPLILKYLAEMMTPDLICQKLRLCTAKAGMKKVMPATVKNAASCEICELVVGYVYKMVDSKTEAEITAEVEKLCDFAGSYKDKCKSFVAAYLPEIINLLKKELSPALVCKELRLCTAMSDLLRKVKIVKGAKNGALCTVCKMAVGFVDAELKNSKTEAEIAAEFGELCSYLKTFKAQCQSYVKAYLPLILKYLAQAMTPDAVCKELRVCTAAQNPKMVLLKKSLPLAV